MTTLPIALPPATAKPRRRLRWPRGMDRVNLMLGGWSAVILLFLYIPILVLCVWSFNAADYSSKWEGFTTKWYSAFWHRTMLDWHDAVTPADTG